MWELFKTHYFYRHFEHTAYLLGNRRSVTDMFLHRERHTTALAVKILFQESAMPAIACACVTVLFVSAYCVRVAEAPNNKTHSTYFWNQLWLVVATMTTTGYGDTVPYSHFGRLACVATMGLGTVLVSFLTAGRRACAFLPVSAWLPRALILVPLRDQFHCLPP